MTSRVIYDAVSSTLQDIRSHLPGGDCPFGGIPTILGGDFQQILPIVRHGNRADSVQACLQFAKVWPHLIHLRLRQNTRISRATLENIIFADWLGKLSFDPAMMGDIGIPDYIHQTSNDSEYFWSGSIQRRLCLMPMVTRTFSLDVRFSRLEMLTLTNLTESFWRN
jgi:hypothetical protein